MDKKGGMKAGLMIILFSMMVMVFAGCNHGSGSDASGTDGLQAGDTTQASEGVFIDSPVEGLDYKTPTHAGITDADGHFMYEAGEMVMFSIGDVVMGQAMAKEVMTPLDFVDDEGEGVDITNPMVTNMGRFLQSMDTDGDPENGITISQAVRGEINGRMIDFDMGIHDFENSADVMMLFDTLNAMGVFHNGQEWALCSAEDARQHMSDHMGQYMNDHMGLDDGDGDPDHMNNSMMTGQINDDTDSPDMPGAGTGMDYDDMNDYMDDHMDGSDMGDHMGFDGEDGGFDHMNGSMGGHM